MRLAEVLGNLPDMAAVPFDEQGTWVVFLCEDCDLDFEYEDASSHLQEAHSMSPEDAEAYIAYLMGGPKEVRRIGRSEPAREAT